MIDQSVVQGALARMRPSLRQEAEERAKRRGVTAADIVMEQCLGQLEDQLYALRKKGRPALRVV
ncbi:hypothetical protein [Litchfieldella xinjiangensis]|uniref:hypothetical protein n=1 Tax=Litchfieldella xinjiangensis TaxID=1166948 RepID=UPI0005B93500|nr:hypothetical protein [Halomonas xinjiangensis]